MAYSNVGIANLALRRIGIARIASFTEQTPQAIDVNACWEYIRDEVLEAKDWKFAKRRFKLVKNVLVPEYGWSYAYALPEGFLRLAYPSPEDSPVYIYTTYPIGSYPWQVNSVVYPYGYPYKIETLSDGNIYLLSNYDNTDDDVYATCIIKITDPTKYSPSFINALAWRLAQELVTGRTESATKLQECVNGYQMALNAAEGINQSFNSLKNEIGNSDWLGAGRY